MPTVTVDNHKDGVYVEQYDVHSKYERLPRETYPEIANLTMAQMMKMYSASWGNKSEKRDTFTEDNSDVDDQEVQGEDPVMLAGDKENSDRKFLHVMSAKFQEGEGPRLPKIVKLNNPYPGEPPFMKLRTKPAVLRFHKFKIEKDPGAYWFSEAMLYTPHHTEEDLLQQIEQAKSGGQDTWEGFVHAISLVKSQVITVAL